MQDNFNSNDLKTKDDYYNLPLASFTFGRDCDKNIFSFPNPNSASLKSEKPEEQKQQPQQQQQSIFTNLNTSNNPSTSPKNPKKQDQQRYDDKELYAIPINIETHRHMQNNKKPQQPSSLPFAYPSTFINPIGTHNSFLSVILHAIYNMKKLRYYLLNDFPEIKDKEPKTKLLHYLRNTLSKCTETSKKIDISQLRSTLSDLFQNRRKFLIDHPDDPCDCYFALINALHSCFMQFPSNEITDESCREKCFAHKYLWLDMQRIDECECKGSTKRLFSNFNYVFDIQIDQVIDIAKHIHYQYQQQQMNSNISESYGKLFMYYKYLLSQLKSNCPVNGNRCKINNTHKRLVLNNAPMYFVFALTRSNVANNNDSNSNSRSLFTSVYDNLKSLILIPHTFHIESLFEVNSNNNTLKMKRFELLGVVLIRHTKSYTCVFKKVFTNSSSGNVNVMWIYYEDDNVIGFHTWFEFIAFCLKSGDTPLMLFYQIEDESKMNNSNNNGVCNLSKNELYLLERYAHNADNVGKIFMNKLRINEDVIINAQYANKVNSESLKKGGERPCLKGEFMCYSCQCKNSVDNVICRKCGTNNTDIVKEILHIRHSDAKYAFYNNNNNNTNVSADKREQSNFGLNNQIQFAQNLEGGNINNYNNNNNNLMQTPQHQMQQYQYQQQQVGSAKNQLINPFKVEKKKQQMQIQQQQQQYITNDEPELITSAESKARKYFDMPRQIVPKKDTPVVVKSQNSLHTKHNLHKGNSHKIENNNNNNITNPSSSANSRPKTAKTNQHQLNHHQSNSSRFELSSEQWKCTKCGNVNKEINMKCKICKHIRRSESSYDRVHTPKLQHNNQYNLEKKHSQKNIEHRKSSDKYKVYNTVNETKPKTHDDNKKRVNIHGIAYGGSNINTYNNNINYQQQQQRPQTANVMLSKYDNKLQQQQNKISAVNVNMNANVVGNIKTKSQSGNKKYFK